VPEMGRWTRRDPIGYVDGVGLYEYVGSRPVDRSDPKGLKCQPVGLKPTPISTPCEDIYVPNNRGSPEQACCAEACRKAGDALGVTVWCPRARRHVACDCITFYIPPDDPDFHAQACVAWFDRLRKCTRECEPIQLRYRLPDRDGFIVPCGQLGGECATQTCMEMCVRSFDCDAVDPACECVEGKAGIKVSANHECDKYADCVHAYFSH